MADLHSLRKCARRNWLKARTPLGYGGKFMGAEGEPGQRPDGSAHPKKMYDVSLPFESLVILLRQQPKLMYVRSTMMSTRIDLI